MITHISDFILFVVINIVNVSTFLFFISGVKWPKLTRKLATLTILMGIPVGVIVFLNVTAGREWFYQVMPSIFVAWTVFAPEDYYQGNNLF